MRNPGARLSGLIGVTGTSGKTTTCHLIEAILQDGSPPGALCSSEAQRIGERAVTISQAVAETVELQRFLADAAAVGAPWVVVEVERTAAGEQEAGGFRLARPIAGRFDLTSLDLTVITNAAESDRPAVAHLIRQLSPERREGRPQAVVLNRDEPLVMEMAAERHLPLLTFGLHPEADVRATEVEASLEGSKFQLHLPGAAPEPCHLQLLGEQNVQNALAAAAVGHLLGLSPATITRALFRCPGLPGRMERIEEGQRFHLVVDRAETPEQLAQVARFWPPGIDRVMLLAGDAGRAFQTRERAFRSGVKRAAHGDLLILAGRPEPGFDPRSVIREVLGDSLL